MAPCIAETQLSASEALLIGYLKSNSSDIVAVPASYPTSKWLTKRFAFHNCIEDHSKFRLKPPGLRGTHVGKCPV